MQVSCGNFLTTLSFGTYSGARRYDTHVFEIEMGLKKRSGRKEAEGDGEG